MDWKQLQEVNQKLKATDIKGNLYIEVSQRIKAFRELCPNGSIETEILSNENGVCLIKAVVKDETGKVLGTGHSHEKEGSSFINKTSYIENAETSCVGRALGMLGIGIETSIASAEEVVNAINQGKEEKVEKKKELDPKLVQEAFDLGLKSLHDLAVYYKKKEEDLTDEDLKKVINRKKRGLKK